MSLEMGRVFPECTAYPDSQVWVLSEWRLVVGTELCGRSPEWDPYPVWKVVGDSSTGLGVDGPHSRLPALVRRWGMD